MNIQSRSEFWTDGVGWGGEGGAKALLNDWWDVCTGSQCAWSYYPPHCTASKPFYIHEYRSLQQCELSKGRNMWILLSKKEYGFLDLGNGGNVFPRSNMSCYFKSFLWTTFPLAEAHQSWYLQNVLHQHISRNIEIYPRKSVLIATFHLGISINRIGMISQFSFIFTHMFPNPWLK